MSNDNKKKEEVVELEGYEFRDAQSGIMWFFNRDTEDFQPQFEDCPGA